MGGLCAYCHSALGEEEDRVACAVCGARFHAECWAENGGCAVYGCSQTPTVEPRRALEIPVSHWGREQKPCPACGHEILAAAVRCRHCGATFASADLEDAAQFRERTRVEANLPAVRRTVPWLFATCVISCLAPIGLIWGGLWYQSHRKEVSALPSLYSALCKVGLAVAVFQLLAMILLGACYSLLRGP